MQHALHMRSIVICGLFGCTLFFHIISLTARFFLGVEKVLIVKRVVWFSLQLLSKTFLICEELSLVSSKVYIGLLVKYLYSIQRLVKLEFSGQSFEKY